MLASTKSGNGGKIGFYFTDTEIIPVGIKGCFKYDKDDKKVHCWYNFYQNIYNF